MFQDNGGKSDKIQAFDTLFTNNHIQMYKLLLPYFPSAIQKQLAVYIKYLEFQYTLSYFKRHPYAYDQCTPPDTGDICKEILPYCSTEEKEKVKRFMDLSATMKNAQEMMETISMMQEIFPEGFPTGDGKNPDFDFMQMFGSFVSPDSK